MTDDELHRLFALRETMTNVVGFYDLLYDAGLEHTPVRRMINEAHFATSARHLAIQLHWILEDIENRIEGDGA